MWEPMTDMELEAFVNQYSFEDEDWGNLDPEEWNL